MNQLQIHAIERVGSTVLRTFFGRHVMHPSTRLIGIGLLPAKKVQ